MLIAFNLGAIALGAVLYCACEVRRIRVWAATGSDFSIPWTLFMGSVGYWMMPAGLVALISSVIATFTG